MNDIKSSIILKKYWQIKINMILFLEIYLNTKYELENGEIIEWKKYQSNM